jgi:hypothetical protein
MDEAARHVRLPPDLVTLPHTTPLGADAQTARQGVLFSGMAGVMVTPKPVVTVTSH